jgi:hypothetical protein
MNTGHDGEPDFDRLGFASQMIVWATRKRLHLLASGDSEDNVIEALGIAGFDELHACLMQILDVLLCGASNRIRLHAVACPWLSPHEVDLLNALAYLQRRDQAASQHCLRELCGPVAAPLVQPAVQAIVDDLDVRGLRLTLVAGHQAARARSQASIH